MLSITSFPFFSVCRFPAGFSGSPIVIGTTSTLSLNRGPASQEQHHKNQLSHIRGSICNQEMNVPPQFRAKAAPSRGYKIARAIILPMALFVITFTFTSKFSVDPAKVDVRACHSFLSLAAPSDLATHLLVSFAWSRRREGTRKTSSPSGRPSTRPSSRRLPGPGLAATRTPASSSVATTSTLPSSFLSCKYKTTLHQQSKPVRQGRRRER